MTARDAWDPELADRIRKLRLASRQLARDVGLGAHASRQLAVGAEFAEHGAWRPGMALRHVDWRAWARTDRLLARRTPVEVRRPIVVVLDLSADLGVGTSAAGGRPDLNGSPAGLAIVLAGTLAVWAAGWRDPVGLDIVAGDDAPVRHLPPRPGNAALGPLLAALARARTGGRADLGEAFPALARRWPPRSMVFLITDGMEDPASWLPALRGLASRRVELRVIQLVDESQRRLDGVDLARLVSPEDGSEVVVDATVARAGLTEAAAAFDRELEAGLAAVGARRFPIPVAGPVARALAGALVGAGAS